MSSFFYSFLKPSFLSQWQLRMLQAVIGATVSVSFSVSERQEKIIVHKTPSAFVNLGLLSTASPSFPFLTQNTLQVYHELREHLDAANVEGRNKQIESTEENLLFTVSYTFY